MTDLNLTGPALRLIYGYLGDANISDAEKVAFAGELLGLVGEHQTEIQAKLVAAMHTTGVIVGAIDLLRFATVKLVREMMSLPPDAADAGNHPWHCVGVAEGVEAIFERLGYWTIAASQARIDVKSAKLRTISVAVDATKASSQRSDAMQSPDWNAEDDRLVLIARIADVIETMPIDKLQHVLEAVTGIRDLD